MRKSDDDIIEIGDKTYIWGAELKYAHFDEHARTKIRIGKYCSIAMHIWFLLGGNHYMGWITTFPFCQAQIDRNLFKHHENIGKIDGRDVIEPSGDIIIGNDVWLGFHSVVMAPRGLTIGDGAIVGAWSVVTKDVEPYTIVAGNPARPIRKRFDDETIRRIRALNWWDWPDEHVDKVVHNLLSTPSENLTVLEAYKRENGL